MRIGRAVDVEGDDDVAVDLAESTRQGVSLAFARLIDDPRRWQCGPGGLGRGMIVFADDDDHFEEAAQVREDLQDVGGFILGGHDDADARLRGPQAASAQRQVAGVVELDHRRGGADVGSHEFGGHMHFLRMGRPLRWGGNREKSVSPVVSPMSPIPREAPFRQNFALNAG